MSFEWIQGDSDGPIARTVTSDESADMAGATGHQRKEQERLEGERKGLYLAWGERDEGPFQSVSPRHPKGLVQMHQEQMELL